MAVAEVQDYIQSSGKMLQEANQPAHLSSENMTRRQRELFLDQQIGDAEAQAISEALKVNTTLTQFGMGTNQIGDAGATAIAEALKVNGKLYWVELEDNQIGDAGAQAIAEALRVNTTLKYLILYANRIGDAGAQAIAEALKVNKTLTSLRLSKNQIGDAGAQAIAEALKVNTNLNCNCIGKAGAQALNKAQSCRYKLEFELETQTTLVALCALPRPTTAEDAQSVFHLLMSGFQYHSEAGTNMQTSPHLPRLPAEVAELIMDAACYWPGVHVVEQSCHDPDEKPRPVTVTVPKSTGGNGSPFRVQVVQLLRDRREHTYFPRAIDWIIRDEHGAVRYKGAATPVAFDSTIEFVTMRAADHAHIRQMREGWQFEVQPGKAACYVRLESLFLGYI
ncbi:hypothetical protein CAOG_05042 [Capsaspora owczarzaki ATCC 30864]|uniref:hypothetical protein n=1 Tax=Capsaspora owczarzaki (strain ATCC 30864) TaxID=595528 RepID=UPI0001FE2704|nr:hypothetical protein CAOG_05042 [Capsaspora owczarzaki ATCC 30864]|eukprot:XP_004346727.1 hypothetical protein CAOG_05042 [Capsaspora owczarzaki ATCC 30864]